MPRSPNQLTTPALAAVACTLLALLSIWIVDGIVATALNRLSDATRALIGVFVDVVEALFAFGVTPFLYGLIVIAAAVVLRLRHRGWEPLERALLFVGLVHVVSRLIADILKPPFSRLPFWLSPPDGALPSPCSR